MTSRGKQKKEINIHNKSQTKKQLNQGKTKNALHMENKSKVQKMNTMKTKANQS